MTGNSEKRRLVVQPRDRRLFEEFAIMRVIDREQAKIVAGFRSTTRANARLLALVRAGLLRRFFLASGKALYVLSDKGARLVGVPLRGPRRRSDEVLVADLFIEHQLAVNGVYCAMKYPAIPVSGVQFRRWFAFHEPVTNSIPLIPDGYMELTTPRGILAAFIEVDLGQERGPVWKDKASSYLQLALSGDFGRHFGVDRFRVLIVVNSERRLRSLLKTVAAITQKLFWFATLDAVHSKGLFAPVWYRPTGETAAALIEERP